ncbi:MAG TPA: tetratricopeptide repeat protein [Thermoanaerobaculia bacterium]|nr:tetratricopeptide repeat protein [Thermoanaerobaculia bacterium]
MADLTNRLHDLVNERVSLETKLQREPGELSDAAAEQYDRQYAQLQRQIAALFREATDDQQRITMMLELMRILENRLVYLHNFIVEATPDNRVLAQLATKFIDSLQAQSTGQHSTVLTPLEATYYRAVAALYSGDPARARECFTAACESEESDEANDIKYKSFVILGNLSHEERDYARAKDLHDQSLRYSQSSNVTAQALALKALNVYALQEYDEALHLFEEALTLFDPNEPFFNSYFYRNSLLFCGAIYFDRRDYAHAEARYRTVMENVDQNSYDHFDALAHLGRMYYAQGRWDDAATTLEQAVQMHHFNENEYVLDTWFCIARSHIKRNAPAEARGYLEKIAASEVEYEKKPQAVELLRKVS